MKPSETTVRFECLSELVAMTPAQREQLDQDDLKVWLNDFVAAELPGTRPPEPNTAAATAAVIDMLAQHKTAWARHLGDLVIAMADAESEMQQQAVTDALKVVSVQCPWKYLRESASLKLPDGA